MPAPLTTRRRPHISPPPVRPTMDAVRRELAELGVQQLLRLDYEIVGQRVIVRGELPSYYLKQLVQERLRHVPGVRQVDNRTRVA